MGIVRKRTMQLPGPFRCLLPTTLLLGALRLDELGGDVRREAAEFCTLDAKEVCAGASIAGIASRVEGAHPVLVSAGILSPVLACQERQPFVAVTVNCCGSFGARGFDSLVGFAHAGSGFCSPLRDLCSLFG